MPIGMSSLSSLVSLSEDMSAISHSRRHPVRIGLDAEGTWDAR